MNSRERILAALRSHPAPFAGVTPPPAQYMPVARTPEGDLVARFAEELAVRHGQATIARDAQHAIDTVLALIGTETEVLSWPVLPLPGLAEALAERGIIRHSPRARDAERVERLVAAEPVRVGISGANAGFATTGTLVLASLPDQNRLPTLLAPLHIALLRREQIYPRLEEWIVTAGVATIRSSSSVVLVTGPSSTGDIEQHHILGAHGPEDLHVVII